MILAAQYYRAPFPEKRFWKQDFDAMKAAGLNAVQLWVLWSWVEPEPGVYRFEDYDELFDEAEARGMGVVLSAIAELHPLWIHRVYPDAHMIDHMGRPVISSNRVEAHQGLTPGGCTDHPAIREAMGRFLRAVAERYRGRRGLLGWDCWNELRWNVQSDALVCYCPHTLDAFRQWLRGKYGGLDGLNATWKRRYCDWADVFPGKLPKRPYTEMMEFEAFLQRRAADHARFRYEAIKSVDPEHLVSAHGPQPSYAMAGDMENHAMNRGNDFDIAAQLDGYGCSHFPFWFQYTDEEFGVCVESTRSAAAGKTVWVSELQGGSARQGFAVYASVKAAPQQRWVWNGFARGAKAVIFWCWRDEVFGKESSGYGLAGMDGLAGERLASMKATGGLLARHDRLFEQYKPDAARVAVFFSPDSYNLEWAQDGAANRTRESIIGYMTAFERIHVPYDMVDSGHAGSLSQYRLLVLPWPLVVPPEAAAKIIEFVRNGGALIAEADLDAYTQTGFFRYPGPDREFAAALGVEDFGRRAFLPDRFDVNYCGAVYSLRMPQSKSTGALLSVPMAETGEYVTPMKHWGGGDSIMLGSDGQGNALAIQNTVGRGTVIAMGALAGRGYAQSGDESLERLLSAIVRQCDAGHEMKVTGSDRLQWRTGLSGRFRLLFVMNPGDEAEFEVEAPARFFSSGVVVDLTCGVELSLDSIGYTSRFSASVEAGGYRVFQWDCVGGGGDETAYPAQI